MTQRQRTLALLFLAILPTHILSASDPYQPVQDWSHEASIAQQKHQPIMLLFTSRDCHYCDELQREVISPMRLDGTLPAQVHLREFSIERGGKLIDFDGERIRARLFVGRYHVYATPTVILLDYRGRPLGEPIVGYNGLEGYQPILQQAINQAAAYPTLRASNSTDGH